MTSRRFRSRLLCVERLESRDLLAGDVQAVMYGNMLVIWGDNEANGVVLTYESTTQAYHVIGKEAGGSDTTINGVDTSDPANDQTFTGVKQVAVVLHDGDSTAAAGAAELARTNPLTLERL